MIDLSKLEKQMTKYNEVQGLMKYFTVDNLKEIHKQLDGNKALGVDKMSKERYDSSLEANLNNLLNKMKKFEYYPQPVRRTEIPKPNGKVRRLGIPGYEDKIVQKMMTEILNCIYENIFEDCSYGFRPNRNCHDALLKINEIINTGKVNYIVDTDIKGFFDNLDQNILINILQKVIKDKHFIKYVRRFLRAGIMDSEIFIESNRGTPQGGIISPILANIYLHYVLDQWFENEIKKKTMGQCYIIRYADDFVMLFECYEDSIYVYKEVIKRLSENNLELQEEKTRIFKFNLREKNNNTFDYLGITIYNYEDKENVIKLGMKTSEDNISKKYEVITKCIYDNKEEDMSTLCSKVNEKLKGYYNYYGFDTNLEWLIDIYQYSLIEVLNLYIKRYGYTIHNLNDLAQSIPICKPYISIYL